MKLSNLAGVLRDAGLTVVECAGWSNRGYAGQDLKDVRGVLWHHTATNRQRFNDSDAPTLSMCVNGRIDLAGPLCNIVFGRNGTVYLVAAGVANHAGAGSAAGVPANMGNHYLIGVEMESSGIAPWDWTPDQLRVAPHLGAALERAYGASLQIAHYEYSSQGKIDPAGWPGGMDGLRDSINAILSGTAINLASTGATAQSASSQSVASITPKEWDEMASEEQLEKLVRRVVWGGPGGTMIHNHRLGRGEYPETILGALEGRIQNEILPSMIGPLLDTIKSLAGNGSDLDVEDLLARIGKQVEDSSRAGAASAIDGIDVTVRKAEG